MENNTIQNFDKDWVTNLIQEHKQSKIFFYLNYY
jgi:hypothetical protein